jgi:RNA polymerase sigma factor (sigma-70 family)
VPHELEADIDALMGRLAIGDRSAFEPLFRLLYPRAQRFALARLGGDGAQDVAQTAMLKLFANAHRFHAGRPALPWFYAIVANEIRAARRQTRVQSELSEHGPQVASAEDEALERELQQALHQAIATLDEASEQAIRAQLEQTDRPPVEATAFRKRVSRAYARLRILLGDFR